MLCHLYLWCIYAMIFTSWSWEFRNLQSFEAKWSGIRRSEKKLRAADIPRDLMFGQLLCRGARIRRFWCSATGNSEGFSQKKTWQNSWNSMRRVRFPASRRFHHSFANFSHVFCRKSLWLPLVLASCRGWRGWSSLHYWGLMMLMQALG